MKKFTILLLVGAVAFLCRNASAQVYSVNAVGYLNVQGMLRDSNNVPINGFMDFCWWIYAAPTGGTALAHDTNMNNSVLVSNGLANATLNVGNLTTLGLSPTQELYLELDVRPSGTSNAFTVLSPRQRIVPSMFATRAVLAEEARRLIEPLTPDLLPAVPDSALSSNVALLNGNPKFTMRVQAPSLRLMDGGGGATLIFGPTMNCTIGIDPVFPGFVFREAHGIRLLNSATPAGPNRILFGPTDDCSIVVSNSNSGMRFYDPAGFTFGSQVTVNGPVFAQAFVPTSSRRFKNDVKPIEQPLEKISRLQGVRFKWNEDKGGQKDVGFIAEDVAQVIPEVVSWEEDGKNARGVNYDHLVAVAIEGIKAQQSQIQTLERENAELKDSLTAMQARLERLSRQMESLKAR